MSSDDVGEKNGAAEGTRTPDPIITNDVLYQLSYSGILLFAGLCPLCCSWREEGQAAAHRAAS